MNRSAHSSTRATHCIFNKNILDKVIVLIIITRSKQQWHIARNLLRLSTSSCIRRLFGFGRAAGVIEKSAYGGCFFKEAKAAALQERRPSGLSAKNNFKFVT
jgi:hypothetical protein